jgi:hypothetical protein
LFGWRFYGKYKDNFISSSLNGCLRNFGLVLTSGFMLADKAKDGVSCGVSVTPVVDWRFYGKYNVYFITNSLNECCESFSLVKKQESC